MTDPIVLPDDPAQLAVVLGTMEGVVAGLVGIADAVLRGARARIVRGAMAGRTGRIDVVYARDRHFVAAIAVDGYWRNVPLADLCLLSQPTETAP